MNIEELLKFRKDLLENSIDEDGYTSPVSVLENTLPSLVETKLVESEVINIIPPSSAYAVIGYWENESGERLQLFLMDVDSVSIDATEDNILHKRKDHHNTLFKLGLDFVKKSINRHLNDELQDSDPLAVLYQKLGSSNYIDQIDVVEIILLSSSISVETRGKEQTIKRFLFDDSELKTSFTRNRIKQTKEILFQYKLVDIGYLYQVSLSQGNADPLEVKFGETFGSDIEVLKAAEEEHFESYLCVLPASGLANLYRKESSRLLEKNVRSFLNFKVEANKEMRNTIRNNPEKFIAYNNGLTITGSSGDIKEQEGKLFMKSITDFQIVNGGQTTAGIYFSYKDGLDISKINLMAKINIAKDVSDEELNELISNISRFSNTQSKVSKVDLKTSNTELKTIKTLSRSVVAPNQNKWYFDLAKGEFNTLVKLRGNKKKLEKEYPKQRRFSKEQLGKYYTAWGLNPFLVKLGGVKVFRYFIEEISGDGDKKKPQVIDRDFYEALIARVIMFRELEILHGAGKNAIGQLRSAVIPYTMSAIYLHMNAKKKSPDFNLELLWKNQELDDFMRSFFFDLMKLMNQLVKDYAQTDDYGTYARKEQLWIDISKSKEIANYFNSDDAQKFIEKYGVPKSKLKSKKKSDEVDFTTIQKTVQFASNGSVYYKDILRNLKIKVGDREEQKISRVLQLLKMRKDIGEKGVLVIESLIEHVRTTQSDLLTDIARNENEEIIKALDAIIKQYSNAKSKGVTIESEFNKSYSIASSKDIKYSSVLKTIGEKLQRGDAPSLSDVYLASNFYSQVHI